MIADEAGARAWLRGLPDYDSSADERLDELVRLLDVESKRQNLVAAASLDHVWQRHVVDSAQLLGLVPRETPTWLDLGTGAGFPGLVIAILRPSTRVTLVESRSLRGRWLQDVVAMLDLDNVAIMIARLEALPSFASSVISARAFAPLSRLMDLSARFSTTDTTWVLPKGKSARDELCGLRGWKHTFHVEQSLTDPDAGIITGRLIGTEEHSDDLRRDSQPEGRGG